MQNDNVKFKIEFKKRLNIFHFGLSFLTLIFAFSIWTLPAEASTIVKPSNFLTLSSGLVGWWTFDGPDIVNNVTDRSGQGKTGYMINFGATSTAQVPGKLGQGLKFDKVDDVIRTSVDTIAANTVTVSAWIKPISVGETGTIGSIVDNSKFRFNMATNGRVRASSDNGITSVYSADGGVPFNVWTHVLVVRLDTGQATFYINGVLSGAANQNSGTPGAGLHAVFIGNRSATDLTFDGAIDDVRIYNRALSASEIQQLYNTGAASKVASTPAGAAGAGLNAGLVGHWTFDGPDLLTNVSDRSGQGNTGYLILGATGNTATTTKIGKIGQALQLDGVDDRVRFVPTITAYPQPTSNTAAADMPSFTLSVWAKRTVTVNIQNIIIGKRGSNAGIMEGPRFSLWDTVNGENQVSAFAPLNTWYLSTMSYNNSTQIADCYINGVLVGSIDMTGLIFSANAIELTVGGRADASQWNFNGAVDDVRIYNRALSATEVRALYNMGAGTHAAATPQGTSGQGLNAGLIGHWTFDGPDLLTNVRDRSGQGNTGYLVHGGSGTTTAAGKLGQAFNFDGSDDYTALSSNPISSFASANSICLWEKPSDISSSGGTYRTMLNLSTDANNYTRIASQNNGNLTIAYYAGGTSYGQTALGSPIQVNRWTHICSVFSGSTLSVYIDGVSEADFGDSASNGSVNYIGSRGAIGYWSGLIDDVRVYNRALTVSEVRQIYNLGR